jgi:ribosomal protein L11 methyltransferase
MMVSQLLNLQLIGCRVLDCGTGTGILAISALKLGASEAVGYDIDEWSTDNARHNAVINMVDSQFTSLLGDASILKDVEGTFNVVLANINRNILLNDMEAFVEKMAPHSTLLLSGFYQQDIPLLEEKALTLGLIKKAQQHDGDWACLRFEKS